MSLHRHISTSIAESWIVLSFGAFESILQLQGFGISASFENPAESQKTSNPKHLHPAIMLRSVELRVDRRLAIACETPEGNKPET